MLPFHIIWKLKGGQFIDWHKTTSCQCVVGLLLLLLLLLQQGAAAAAWRGRCSWGC
jgi:hypothetical protein